MLTFLKVLLTSATESIINMFVHTHRVFFPSCKTQMGSYMQPFRQHIKHKQDTATKSNYQLNVMFSSSLQTLARHEADRQSVVVFFSNSGWWLCYGSNYSTKISLHHGSNINCGPPFVGLQPGGLYVFCKSLSLRYHMKNCKQFSPT